MTSQKNPEQDKRAARTAIYREQALPVPISGVGSMAAALLVGPFHPLIADTVFGIDKIFVLLVLFITVNVVFTIYFHKFLNTKSPESPWQYLRY